MALFLDHDFDWMDLEKGISAGTLKNAANGIDLPAFNPGPRKTHPPVLHQFARG